jgi:hypothetical protein
LTNKHNNNMALLDLEMDKIMGFVWGWDEKGAMERG